MTPLLRPAGLGGRLFVLTLVVLIPIVAATATMAFFTHRQAMRVIEAARAQVVWDYVNRASLWLHGSARMLAPAYANAARAADPQSCAEQLRAAFAGLPAARALIFAVEGRSCTAQSDPAAAEIALAPLAMAERERLRATPEGAVPIRPRYGSLVQQSRRFLLVQFGRRQADGGVGIVMAALDPSELDAAFDAGALRVTQVALVSLGDGAPLAARGDVAGAAGWLPNALPESRDYQRFDAASRAGDSGAYATRAVDDSDLAVVTRFPGSAEAEARRNAILLAATPLLAALFIVAVYAMALQRGVIGWVMGIKRAARARLDDPASSLRAPVSERMPRELRSVATALNAVLDDVQARERELGRTLEQNRFLMRELHHRVKNSLQVIQSYLSLSRREADLQARGELTETEARVLVLSVAYRLALSDGGMRPVPLRPLAEEIVGYLAATLRRDTQWISLDAEVDAQLVVDRAIPFGLAIVEMVMASLCAPDSTRIAVTLATAGSGVCELTIAADGAPTTRASSRIMQGLALQLQATQTPLERDMRLRWRFTT